jgi:hypothetical protein
MGTEESFKLSLTETAAQRAYREAAPWTVKHLTAPVIFGVAGLALGSLVKWPTDDAKINAGINLVALFIVSAVFQFCWYLVRAPYIQRDELRKHLGVIEEDPVYVCASDLRRKTMATPSGPVSCASAFITFSAEFIFGVSEIEAVKQLRGFYNANSPEYELEVARCVITLVSHRVVAPYKNTGLLKLTSPRGEEVLDLLRRLDNDKKGLSGAGHNDKKK